MFLLLAAWDPRAAKSSDAPPPDPDLSTAGTRRVGPFRIRPFILLKDVGYDDNIRFEAQTREGDNTATAGTGLEALLLAGDRGGLRLFQELDYVAFGRNSDLNHWNNESRARGILLLKTVVLSLEDHFMTARERPNTEIDQRVRRDNNAVTAALRSISKGRLGVRTYLRRESIDYGSGEPGLEDIGRVLNRDENTLAVIGEVKILPKTTFTLGGEAQRIDFRDSGGGRDSRIHSILPGFRFDPSASVQGEFRIGVTRFEAPDRPEDDYRGTTGEGRLSARLGHAARLKGTFDRRLAFSVMADNLYYLSTTWSVAYEQFFSRRLSGELLYSRGINHYPREVLLSVPLPVQGIRDDRLTSYQATVRYRINPEISLTMAGNRFVRDSTDDAFDRDRNYYAFGTSYNF